MKTKIVEKVYFDCGNPKHFHIKEDVAYECMLRYANIRFDPDTSRDAKVLELRGNGATFLKIGDELGVSSVRARQLFIRAAKRAAEARSADDIN